MTEKEYIERLKKQNIMIDERIKNIKIYVDGKSAEIQKVLFALGAKWCDGEQTPYATDKPFLYVDENGIIEHCDNMEFFSIYEYKEVSASEVLSWKPKKPKPVLKPYAPYWCGTLKELSGIYLFTGTKATTANFTSAIVPLGVSASPTKATSIF